MVFLSYNYKYRHPIKRHLLLTPRTYYVSTPCVPCGGGVDKPVDKYVRLDMNYTLPNILILLTLM